MDSAKSYTQKQWEHSAKWHSHYSKKKAEYIEKLNNVTSEHIIVLYKGMIDYAQSQINHHEDKFPQLKNGKQPKPKVIYETYTLAKANNIVEYGYSFKIEGENDTIEDMTLGEIDMSLINAGVKIQQDWNNNERKAEHRSIQLTKSYC